jgi:tRNA(adenine34) deaminase
MNFTQEQQEKFIRLAMEQVEESIKNGGTPFGAVLVDVDGKVLAVARNTVTPETDILRHAELNLLREANIATGLQKFPDCAVFINAASCTMCASAMIQAGIRNFYYGAPFEPHTNPGISYEGLAQYCDELLHITSGILEAGCKAQIEGARAAETSGNKS